MDGNVLMRGFRRGFSVWEMAVGLLVVAVATGAVATTVRGRLEVARGARARQEMAAILAGCRQYDALHGMWPDSWRQLQEVLPGMNGLDPWGKLYILASDERRAWVTAQAPSGSLKMLTGRMYGSAGRLAYEQRNVYGPR